MRGYSFDENTTYSQLKTALETINSSLVNNLSLTLGMDSANKHKSFTLIIWAEHNDQIDAEAIEGLSIVPFTINVEQLPTN